MEELIKSVRIRPRQAPSGYKSESYKGGLLDIKISVVRTGKKERFCSAHKLNSSGEESGQFWYSLTYKGRRYEDLSDDELIEDYVRTNTLRERPVEGEFVTIEGIKLPYYQIVQDPFEKIPPVSRVFGFDPYHLNNGAQLYIRWYSSEKKKVEWSYDDVTNASQSSIGEVSIRITTNQPERDPLFFTYSSSNNPLQAGVTPSYIDIESYWEYQSEQLTSLTSNNLIYLPPGEEFVDSDSLGIAGGTKYAIKSDANFAIDGFIESGDARITSTSSLKPEGLVKRVEILPPDEHPIWVLSDKTSDSISVFDPIYKRDMGTNSNEKYFIDNSTNGGTNGLDWQIIGDLLSAWNKKIPGYNVELCSPAFLPNKKIDYKDPVAPIDETITEDVESEATGASQSGKIKLNILFPNEFEVEARKDCPDFRIFVGDIPTELLPGEGFAFQDDFESLDELDDEYKEAAFFGPEEDIDELSGVVFAADELRRDENQTVEEASQSEQEDAGVNFGGSSVESPSGSVSRSKINIPSELASVQNSKVLSKQSLGSGKLVDIKDITSPSGDKLKAEDIIKDMNQFIQDVLAPFAKWLKNKYPTIYKNWYITSATRGYVPSGGSLTSQHFKGQAIDSQYLGSKASNPDKNIELMNAILEWYKENPVGYGQILFETRTKDKNGNKLDSCWIHWSYTRGVKRLMFARFSNDTTLKAPANKTGSYVLPPLNRKSLGF